MGYHLSISASSLVFLHLQQPSRPSTFRQPPPNLQIFFDAFSSFSLFLFLHFISFAKSSLPLAGSSSCLLPPLSSSLKEHLFMPASKLGQMRPIHASQKITSVEPRDHPGGCGAHMVTGKHTGVISSVCMKCSGEKTYLWIWVRFSVWCAVKNPGYLLQINEEPDVSLVWLKSKLFFSRNTRHCGAAHFLFLFSSLPLPSPSFPFLLQ